MNNNRSTHLDMGRKWDRRQEEMRTLKKIHKELILIKKELQVIRSSLELGQVQKIDARKIDSELKKTNFTLH